MLAIDSSSSRLQRDFCGGRFCQRIKKAPGKYVVLGGRRTTRLISREPVDWSSTKASASLLCLAEHNIRDLTTSPFSRFRAKETCDASAVIDLITNAGPHQSRVPNVDYLFPRPQHATEDRELLFNWSRRIQARIQNFAISQFHGNAQNGLPRYPPRPTLSPLPTDLQGKRRMCRPAGPVAPVPPPVKQRSKKARLDASPRCQC
jgi:hypothetical protein